MSKARGVLRPFDEHIFSQEVRAFAEQKSKPSFVSETYFAQKPFKVIEMVGS